MDITADDLRRIMNKEMSPETAVRREETLRRAREERPRFRPGILIKPGVIVLTEDDLREKPCPVCSWKPLALTSVFVTATGEALVQRDLRAQEVVRQLTGLSIQDVEKLVVGNKTPEGLDTDALAQNVQTHFSSLELGKLFDLHSGGKVTVHQLDLVLSFAQLYADLRLVFDKAKTLTWLSSNNPHLEGRNPLDLLRSRTGERRLRDHVANLLARPLTHTNRYNSGCTFRRALKALPTSRRERTRMSKPLLLHDWYFPIPALLKNQPSMKPNF